MLKSIFLSVALVVLNGFVFAQPYNTSFGVKGEWSTLKNDLAELSVKHFFSEHQALEVNLGFGNRYLWVEGNHHINFRINKSLDWYVGYGLNSGYFNTVVDRSSETKPKLFLFGFGGNAGIELTTNVIPLNFVIDAGPTVLLIPDAQVGVRVGFAARYAIR